MSTRPPPEPPAANREPSSCWLQGCLILAMVVSAALVLVLIFMVMARISGANA